MRLLGLLLSTLLLFPGCGGEDAAAPQRAPSSSTGAGAPAGQPPVDGPREDTRSGPVPVSGKGGCAEDYAAATVADRAFAFDGSVTARGDGEVTFEVHEWFVGDGPETFTVRMGSPTTSGMSESAPSYFVGTRMLVSGEQEGGPIAWSCGFTRYYDEETASAWRS